MADTLDDAAARDPMSASDAGVPATGVSPVPRAAAASARPRQAQWREEFPYHHDADDLVTRRDTLRFLLAGTGALFVATAVVGAAGNLAPGAASRAVAVARVGELAPNEVRVFTFPDAYAQGILVNLPGTGLVAYSDVCTHLSCAVLYRPGERQFFCPCHDGRFDAATGAVLAGPPTRPLPRIALRTRGGVVFAVREVAR